MIGIWGECKDDKNIALVFLLRLPQRAKGRIRLSAASAFQLYADGEMLGFGPNRTARGYARVSEFAFEAKTLAVEVVSYRINSFCYVDQPPFFFCEVDSECGSYTHEDFECRRLSDRVQKVQRFSFQRTFAEVYDMQGVRGDYSRFEKIGVRPAGEVELLDSRTLNPVLRPHAAKACRTGSVKTDPKRAVWRDRAHENVGRELKGYPIEEWQEHPTDEACRFVFDEGGEDTYTFYDFGRILSGFWKLNIKTDAPCTVHLIFDEVLTEENGKEDILFYRSTCSNVIKWTLRSEGEYRLSSFEPYAARYAKVVVSGAEGCRAELCILDFENPEAHRMQFEIEDKEAESILKAARSSFAQNAIDLFTDCSSRERAGWLSDSWFTAVSERLFTGENRVERAFLQNYLLSDSEGLPEGMIPMCYPSGYYDGMYIPNWAMWYVLEIVKYAFHYGKDETVLSAYEKVKGIADYFAAKYNEYGLLEDLESWVFVEWSKANDPDRVCGVNIPSNICWAEALAGAGSLYGRKDWQEASERIRFNVKKFAFDGKLFVDNLIRKNGRLERTDKYSEVCQYYAFWFHLASKEEYPALYDELMNRLGLCRKEGYRPEIVAPNAMFGIYMRLDLLMREGNRRRLYEECKGYFLKMANLTGTLWENNFVYGSCDHAFASYAAKWLVYALTGYDCESGKTESEEGIGIRCRFEIPKKEGSFTLIR